MAGGVIYRWTKLGSPCLAKGCGLPRQLAPAVHGPGTMGLHPADNPAAPAGGWVCSAGHSNWIPSGEVEEVAASPFARLAEVEPQRRRRCPVSLDQLIERDGPLCCWCGRRTRRPTVEHLLPRSRGGTDHPDNLAVACACCNHQRSNDLGPPIRARSDGWATRLWWSGEAPWGRPAVDGGQGSTAPTAAARGGNK